MLQTHSLAAFKQLELFWVYKLLQALIFPLQFVNTLLQRLAILRHLPGGVAGVICCGQFQSKACKWKR
jgi:hypothetical protein